MTWLKATWTALGTALLAALAVFAVANARAQKSNARKWQEKATDIEAGNVVKGVETAAAALTQAKLHESKAAAARATAEARITAIGENNEDMADIIDRWRRS